MDEINLHIPSQENHTHQVENYFNTENPLPNNAI